MTNRDVLSYQPSRGAWCHGAFPGSLLERAPAHHCEEGTPETASRTWITNGNFADLLLCDGVALPRAAGYHALDGGKQGWEVPGMANP